MTSQAPGRASPLELVHLRRDARTSLELAIVGLAPGNLIESLALVSGMLEAIAELPLESPPVAAMLPSLVIKARGALAQWNAWHVEHLGRG